MATEAALTGMLCNKVPPSGGGDLGASFGCLATADGALEEAAAEVVLPPAGDHGLCFGSIIYGMPVGRAAGLLAPVAQVRFPPQVLLVPKYRLP